MPIQATGLKSEAVITPVGTGQPKGLAPSQIARIVTNPLQRRLHE